MREYQYEITNTKDNGASSTYLLQFEEGKCTYLDLNTRMKCVKRTRSSQGSNPRTEFPHPSKVKSFLSVDNFTSMDHCLRHN